MPVAILNFKYSYPRNGKPIFVPTTVGRRIGSELKQKVEASFEFDPIYYHLRAGGHVAALHSHRPNTHFARIDISRFFYSVSRRRVQRALAQIGIETPTFYAKWSTVRNPYEQPKYALPYGFVQSPILASLVLATSEVGNHLSCLPQSVERSVYVDDISLSSRDPTALQEAFQSTNEILLDCGFQINAEKVRQPAPAIDIFNCDLSNGRTRVRIDRIAEFEAADPDEASDQAFRAYCASVEDGNLEE